MKIAERTLGAVTVIDVDGPITLGGGDTDRLGDKVRSLLQQGRKQLIANLAKVSYMDSAGLGELVQAYTTVSRQGGSLKLVGHARGATGRYRPLLIRIAPTRPLQVDFAGTVSSHGRAPAKH